LYARSHSGRMLLRIEDTDRARSTEEAVAAITDGLRWLGLDWDGDAVHQFARADRHREVAEALLESGQAYRCYATPEELAEMREAAQREKRPPRYDGRWRDRDPSEAPPDVPPVIRLKAPQDGDTVNRDLVQGEVTIANQQLDDMVLLRADGTPTYMLSVVVDDHDMGITHVIRGDDHLTNAARQILLYDALGWSTPAFAHIPLIHGPDGAKLSKRHGALGVEAYRDMGILPAAMRNYLLRLGWAHGDDEIISTEQAIAWFDLDGVGRAPARFDTAKLESVNAHYIREAADDALVDEVCKRLEQTGGGAPEETIRQRLSAAMPSLKQRAKTTVELTENAQFLSDNRPLSMDHKAAKMLDDEARGRLARLHAVLAPITDWTPEATEAAVRGFADSEAIKLGKIAQPLRAALTGRSTSPGIFDVMNALGRDETLGRIEDAGAR
ncbi:MAG: glutamate--tRNA ligase, partial [Minwuiales bacterium]|nr:glutamate--tRNA ligase [Minwuiales bacterium]